jgi:hypothetical protein
MLSACVFFTAEAPNARGETGPGSRKLSRPTCVAKPADPLAVSNRSRTGGKPSVHHHPAGPLFCLRCTGPSALCCGPQPLRSLPQSPVRLHPSPPPGRPARLGSLPAVAHESWQLLSPLPSSSGPSETSSR